MSWKDEIRKETEKDIIEEIGISLGGKKGDDFDLNLDYFKYDIQINLKKLPLLKVEDNSKGKIIFSINDSMVKDDFTWEFEIYFKNEDLKTDYENYNNLTLKLDDYDKKGHLIFVLE